MTIYKQTKLKTERLQSIRVEDPIKWIAEYQPNIIKRVQKPTQGEVDGMKQKFSSTDIDLKYSEDDYVYLASIERQKADQEYFMSGHIEPNENGTLKRNNDSLIRRDLICLDYDELCITYAEFIEIIKDSMKGYAVCVFPTIKSTDIHPRMRVIIKPSRPMLRYEYLHIVSEIADKIPLKLDPSSLTWSQAMGLPVVTPKNGNQPLLLIDGEPYPVPFDIAPPSVKVNSQKVANNSIGSIKHDEALQIIDEYIERDRNNLHEYSNYISASAVLAKSVLDNVISHQVAIECAQKIAMGNADWEQGNVLILNQMIAKGEVRTPYDFMSKFNFKLEPKKSQSLKELFEILKHKGDEWREKHEKLNEKTKEVKVIPVSPRSTANIIKNVCHVYLIGEADPELSPLAIYNPDDGTYNKGERFIMRLCLAVEPTLTREACNTVMHFLTVESREVETTDDKSLIVFNNGIYNRETKLLMSFSPEYVFINKISTNYVENATEPNYPDWSFSQWIDELSDGDENKRTLFWQIFANAIDTNTISEVACFFYSEQGSTGKSTFQALLTNLVGKRNVASLKIREFEENFKLASAYGKGLIIGDDNHPKSFNETSENFKSVITGDNVLIEAKREKPFLYYFMALVVQSMNGLPKFADVSDGLLRRLRVIKFNHSYKGQKKNRNIKDKYIKDPRLLEYIACKALDYDSQDFVETKESQEAIRGLALENDKVLQFFEEYVINLKSTRIPTRILFAMFNVWCRDELNAKNNMTRNTFTSEAKLHASDFQWKYVASSRAGSFLDNADIEAYHKKSTHIDPHFSHQDEYDRVQTMFVKCSECSNV